MGKTKRGKGTKLMAVADSAGFPLAISVGSASPHEIKLVEETLEQRFIEEIPERLIGDRAYDSDPLDERLKQQGIEMIAPHRSNRKKPATQDGRLLRRYKRRLFAWLHYFRRIQVFMIVVSTTTLPLFCSVAGLSFYEIIFEMTSKEKKINDVFSWLNVL